jgi:outer membrane protein OmpA-like peptidoglycan-associated protein
MKYFFVILFSLIFTNSQCQETISFYFNSNKFELVSEELENLNFWIQNNKQSKILSIVGMTDEKGTVTFNDELSFKRIDFVVKRINNQIQFREDFKSIGIGESALLSNEDAENRKVTIYFLEKKELFFEEFIINDYKIAKQLDIIKVTDVEKLNLSTKLSLAEVVEKVPTGTLFTLEDIQFQFDSAVLLYNAKLQLDIWLKVLNDNSNMKIVVQGHICCIPIDDIFLSSQRAQAVMNYFLEKGISPDRLQYVGYGSTKPKFKIPEKNGYEALMNRRVEILIIDK